jgi:hypothetical protein
VKRSTKSLTDAQRDNLTAIRDAGGSVERDRYGFHKPGDTAVLRGMNVVAVRSLVKLGWLTCMEGERSHTYALTPEPEITPSHAAALAWQRERFGGRK